MFDCITKYAYRDAWLYYWVCLKGCLVVLLSMLKGMFGCITKYAWLLVVLLSMLTGMFGCITEYV